MPSERRRRLRHTMHGNLGELFRNFDDPISKPRGSNSLVIHDMETDIREIYDNVNEEWIPLTNDLRERIPPTFTFAPRPINVFMELDYFVRGAGLLNHSYIWSVDSIPRENFGKFQSNTNAAFRGRYTVTPWYPQIQTLGKLENGFYVINELDWHKIF